MVRLERTQASERALNAGYSVVTLSKDQQQQTLPSLVRLMNQLPIDIAHPFTPEEVTYSLFSKDVRTILLVKDNHIAGFLSYVNPSNVDKDELAYYQEQKTDLIPFQIAVYSRIPKQTAHMTFVVIDGEHRHQGGLDLLMEGLSTDIAHHNSTASSDKQISFFTTYATLNVNDRRNCLNLGRYLEKYFGESIIYSHIQRRIESHATEDFLYMRATLGSIDPTIANTIQFPRGFNPRIYPVPRAS